MIRILLSIIILFMFFLTRYSQKNHSEESNKPNILIIYTDDQGYGDVSALNPNAKFRTPNIDRIANEGLIFTDGHSSDGVCTPSRYSLLTGRYSWRTSLKRGVLGADGPCLIEKDRMTIASLLKDNGYNTGMVGKWHLQMEFEGKLGQERDWSKPFTDGPIEKGFDYFFGIPASMNFGVLTYLENDKVLDPPVLWTKKKANKNPRAYEGGKPAEYRMTPPYESEKGDGKGWVEAAPSFNDELVLESFAEKAVEYINNSAEEARKGKPFFLYLPLTSPHLPHCTHPDFQGRSNCGNYGDFMEETDYRVGQVLDALKENGLEENTLVIFSSDNGAESNYTHQREAYNHYSCMNFKGGKRDIYEGGHRVPFLMRWPKVIEAGRKVNIPVCQTDYLATIAEIIGVRLPDNSGEDSYSLYAGLKSGDFKEELRGPVIHHSSAGYLAIRDGKWKLNMLRGSGGSLPPKIIKPKEGEAIYELYNIEEDPGESINLYFEYPEKVEELTKSLSKIIKDGRSTAGNPQEYVDEKWPQISWMISTKQKDINRPNIIYILCDDLGYGDIKSMAPEYCAFPTPNVDKLASQGMMFSNAHSGSSVCTPTRYGLLTGRYAWRTWLQMGVVQGHADPLISEDHLTAADFLKEQGYQTAIIGKWHLNFNYINPVTNDTIPLKTKEGEKNETPVGTLIPDGPITKGFDYYYGFHHARAMKWVIENEHVVKEIEEVEMLPLLANKSVEYINTKARDAKKGKPFFLYVPLNSPHTPIVPSKEWKGKSGIGDYGDFVMETDWAAGEIMKALEANNLAENTIVIFSSDNGCSRRADFENLHAQNHYPSAHLRGSKSDIWDGGHRVPFFVRWPEKIKAGSQNDQLICHTDFMATCADILGIPLPENSSVDGISFKPALNGNQIPNEREAVVHHSISGKFAIRKGKWKLIFCPGSGGWTSPNNREAKKMGLPKIQLYDMETDMGEENNVSADHPEIVEELTWLLTSYIENGRSTAGGKLKNDTEVNLWK